MPRKELMRDVRRIVVKVGSSSITEVNGISRQKIENLVSDIVTLRESGHIITIVSSGAVSAGAGALKRSRDNITIPEKQALAAVGQSILMNEYRNSFTARGYEAGQILLTEDDINNRRRYLNVRHTFNSLFDFGIIPVVNENDSVATKELKFGDNDILSAHVTNIVEADLLIILSDIDGFYMDLSDPAPVEEICEITDEVRSRAGGAGSVHGTGGMLSKIKAADIIIKSGEMMIIAGGMINGVLKRILDGEKVGTLFNGRNNTLCSRKRWIAFSTKTRGRIRIDKGAVKALCRDKKSLLSPGIIDVEGDFDSGDVVEIVDESNELIARGIVNYDCYELDIIKGRRSEEIRDLLVSEYFNEVINRDDLIVY